MKTTQLLNSVLTISFAAVFVLIGGGTVFADNEQVDGCATYLRQVSGLDNLACTPGNLSAVTTFSNEGQMSACSDYLENVSGLSNIACTPGNLSAILVFVDPNQPQLEPYPSEDMQVTLDHNNDRGATLQ